MEFVIHSHGSARNGDVRHRLINQGQWHRHHTNAAPINAQKIVVTTQPKHSSPIWVNLVLPVVRDSMRGGNRIVCSVHILSNIFVLPVPQHLPPLLIICLSMPFVPNLALPFPQNGCSVEHRIKGLSLKVWLSNEDDKGQMTPNEVSCGVMIKYIVCTFVSHVAGLIYGRQGG